MVNKNQWKLQVRKSSVSERQSGRRKTDFYGLSGWLTSASSNLLFFCRCSRFSRDAVASGVPSPPMLVLQHPITTMKWLDTTTNWLTDHVVITGSFDIELLSDHPRATVRRPNHWLFEAPAPIRRTAAAAAIASEPSPSRFTWRDGAFADAP